MSLLAKLLLFEAFTNKKRRATTFSKCYIFEAKFDFVYSFYC